MGDLENGWTVSDCFPERAMSSEELAAALAEARSQTTSWDDVAETRLGFAMSAPHPLAVETWASFLPANTNNVGVHTGYGAGKAGTRRLEREAVLSLAGLYHADSVDGHLTSGATEAVLQGLRIGRNAVRDSPADNIALITSEFAHHSVAKAAEVLGLNLRSIPADSSWTLSVESVERAVDEAIADGAKAVLLVATAGYYNSGLCDPVDALSELLRRRAVRDAGRVRYFCYVDAAHGGFVYPFSDPELPFDFRNPGVHAMAVDPHKSGLMPYSCGVLLARKGLFAHVTSVSSVTGVVDDTLTGSRAGAAAAALWSVVFGVGGEGFTALTRECMSRRDALADVLRAADPDSELRLAPAAPVLCAAFSVGDGRLPADVEERYRLVPVNAPGEDGQRRLYYHFYAGHSLSKEQVVAVGRHVGEGLARIRATAAAESRAAASSVVRAAAHPTGPPQGLPPTDCFRHFVVHEPGRRDPSSPQYSFHTFASRRATGEPVASRRWGTANSGREVTIYGPHLDEPFAHEFLGVATDEYSVEFLDRYQQELSLVGATHYSFAPAGAGYRVLVNFEPSGLFRSVEYKFGEADDTDEIQCFTDRTVAKTAKHAMGVRRPHSNDYSFSIDTSLECEVSWREDIPEARLSRALYHVDPLLPRRRHQAREQYRRFPNRYFDVELGVEAAVGAVAPPWSLSQLVTDQRHGAAAAVRPPAGVLGVLARSAGVGPAVVDLGVSADSFHLTCEAVPSERARRLEIVVPRDLGARLAALLPSLDVSRPEEVDLTSAVAFAERVHEVISRYRPRRVKPERWAVTDPDLPGEDR